jgi:hypothetical protein
MVGHQGCLRAIGQIHPGNRVGGRQQPAQPGKLVVTVAVSPGQADPAARALYSRLRASRRWMALA